MTISQALIEHLLLVLLLLEAEFAETQQIDSSTWKMGLWKLEYEP